MRSECSVIAGEIRRGSVQEQLGLPGQARRLRAGGRAPGSPGRSRVSPELAQHVVDAGEGPRQVHDDGAGPEVVGHRPAPPKIVSRRGRPAAGSRNSPNSRRRGVGRARPPGSASPRRSAPPARGRAARPAAAGRGTRACENRRSASRVMGQAHPARRARASIPPVRLVVDRHQASPLSRAREHVFQVGARPQVPQLHAASRAATEERLRPPAGQEHADHVISVSRHSSPDRLAASATNGPSPSGPSPARRRPGRGLLQLGDRALRGDPPWFMHDDTSQVTSMSGSRCDDTMTLTPCAPGRRTSASISSRPFGVHAVGGLVEKQQIGIVDERLRQLDPLLHAGRIGVDVAVARFAEAHVEEDLVRAAAWPRREAGRRARPRTRRSRPRSCPGRGSRSPACSRSGGGRREAIAGVEAEHAHRPARRARKPSSVLSRVVLPAPFGPSRPTAPGPELSRHLTTARRCRRTVR